MKDYNYIGMVEGIRIETSNIEKDRTKELGSKNNINFTQENFCRISTRDDKLGQTFKDREFHT